MIELRWPRQVPVKGFLTSTPKRFDYSSTFTKGTCVSCQPSFKSSLENIQLDTNTDVMVMVGINDVKHVGLKKWQFKKVQAALIVVKAEIAR